MKRKWLQESKQREQHDQNNNKKSKTNNLSFFSVNALVRIWFTFHIDAIGRIWVKFHVHAIRRIEVRSFVDAIWRIGVNRLDRQETPRFHLKSKMKERNNDTPNVSGTICHTTLEMQRRDILHFYEH